VGEVADVTHRILNHPTSEGWYLESFQDEIPLISIKMYIHPIPTKPKHYPSASIARSYNNEAI
jgi:hypothetical protein